MRHGAGPKTCKAMSPMMREMLSSVQSMSTAGKCFAFMPMLAPRVSMSWASLSVVSDVFQS